MLRIKPQDLPAHPMALQLSVVLALAVSMISLLVSYSVGGALARSVAALGLTAAFLHLMLQLQNRRARFNQAFCAICGSSVVIYLVALPLLPYMSPDADGNFDGLVIALVLLLDGWSLIVLAHIFQHTFDFTKRFKRIASIVSVVTNTLAFAIVSKLRCFNYRFTIHL